MDVKIKIIEFSSDVFSKSNQLKDIIISPLFSNTDFRINIFEAISKNLIYKIKAHTPIIKIGLYNGKSLLGIGEFNINKKSQKIKISSENQNKNEDYMFFNGGIQNKIQDNDYYLTLECTISSNNDKNDKNKNSKDINQKNKKKKNTSVEPHKKKLYTGYNIYYKDNYLYNYNDYPNYNKLNNTLKENKKTRTYKYNEDIIKTSSIESKDYLKNNLTSNNIEIDNDDDIFNIKSNSVIIKEDKNKNKEIKNMLFSNNLNNNKTKKKINDNNNNIEKEPEMNIFNLTFKKETFSNGVLMLSNNNEQNLNKPKNDNMDVSKDKDIINFNNLIKQFNSIIINIKNNTFISMSLYILFVEKTSDIFNLYAKLSSKIGNENKNIKKYIKNYNHKIKIILKKNTNLKIKMQNSDIDELLNQNNFQEGKKYYDKELKNINDKLSLFNEINNDFLNNYIQQNNKLKLKRIFEYIISNENNKKYLNEYKNFINSILNKNNEDNIDNEDNYNGNDKENNDNYKNDKKIDLEILKNKIDKLKEQYINENTKREYENEVDKYDNKDKKIKNNEIKAQKKMTPSLLPGNNKRIPNFKKDKGSRGYSSSYTPNGD